MPNLFSTLVKRVARSHSVRTTFRQMLAAEGRSSLGPVHGIRYRPPDYGAAERTAEPRRSALFITARFRTGSTLLWHMLRQAKGLTCYYEPLNSRRWFEEAEAVTGAVDPTHKGVDDYWSEYKGLLELGEYHSHAWSTRNLWMDERSCDLDLEAYIRCLLSQASGFPVLQFNRVDFRLRWLRDHFPEASIVHLVRSPRDQWLSTLYGRRDGWNVSIADFPSYDQFYLRIWVDDLRDVFPCLRLPASMPAYALFYLLWRLSYLHGAEESDLTVRYEDLVLDPVTSFERIMRVTDVNHGLDAGRIAALVLKDRAGKSHDPTSTAWFEDVEARMEDHLSRSLGS